MKTEHDTEPCPPPEHIRFDGDLLVLEAYAQLRGMIPGNMKSLIRPRVKLSGAFTGTLERARAMRGSDG